MFNSIQILYNADDSKEFVLPDSTGQAFTSLENSVFELKPGLKVCVCRHCRNVYVEEKTPVAEAKRDQKTAKEKVLLFYKSVTVRFVKNSGRMGFDWSVFASNEWDAFEGYGQTEEDAFQDLLERRTVRRAFTCSQG